MKVAYHVTLAVSLSMLFVAACHADSGSDTNADYMAGESSQIMVTPDLKALAGQMFGAANAEALLHAAALQMDKYDLDMADPAGRRAWHGRLIREIVDTNSFFKIEIYSNCLNGVVWRYRTPWKPPRKVIGATSKISYSTNGVPLRLASARARRADQLNGAVQTNTVVRVRQ